MKNDTSHTSANPSAPACPVGLTAEEQAVHASISASAFVRRYPAAAVAGKMDRIEAALGAYYVARGFDVMTSNDWHQATRKVGPGEVWLVWSEGQDLRVLGMLLPGGNVAKVKLCVLRAFIRRVDSLGAATLCEGLAA